MRVREKKNNLVVKHQEGIVLEPFSTVHGAPRALQWTCKSLCLPLTGADEPQSMIVMSYRSPWENRGTERGEVGRGKPRTRANTNKRSAAARPEQVEVNGTERNGTEARCWGRRQSGLLPHCHGEGGSPFGHCGCEVNSCTSQMPLEHLNCSG